LTPRKPIPRPMQELEAAKVQGKAISDSIMLFFTLASHFSRNGLGGIGDMHHDELGVEVLRV